MSKIEKLNKVIEALWSGDVKPKWTPPEGLFTKSAEEIARVLKAQSKDLKQAVGRLEFYKNRAGKNLSKEDQDKLDRALELLHKAYA